MSSYDQRQAQRAEYRREQAHKALRDAGMTDDVHGTDPCGVAAAKLLLLFVLAAGMLASLAGRVTI
jgi:hypothetical protein